MMKRYAVGYTTGVFDLFHIGHLNLLIRAKERCERLIVGVSTDELVKSYKGKAPIFPLEERMAIISALRCVDEVVEQTSLDKIEALEKYHFEVLFHGDDWKGSSLYDEITEKLSDKGADVVFLPHTVGVSTTKVSEIIKNSDI